jgi:uncharacterized membrane protein YkoI
MKQFISLLTILGVIFFSPSGMAGRHHGDLDSCLRAASQIKQGFYVKLEYLTLTSRGVKAYEIEIQDSQGIQWELMCEISKGTIFEVEREVKSTSDPLFKKNMKISEDEARKVALAIYPGAIVHTEYEIEFNGAAAYEFDIANKEGATFKVEVDAKTGEITEVAIEKWDIGRETDED